MDKIIDGPNAFGPPQGFPLNELPPAYASGNGPRHHPFTNDDLDGTETALFSGFTEDTGHEPWAFDGAEAELLMDLQPFGPGSQPFEFKVWNGDLYIAAQPDYIYYDLGNLIRIDGETGNAESVYIPPGRAREVPHDLLEAGGDLYFVATPFAMENLYRLDDATGEVEEVWLGYARIPELAEVEGNVFFTHSWEFGAEFFHLNTQTGEVTELSFDGAYGLRSIGDSLYFSSDAGLHRLNAEGEELGTLPGVRLPTPADDEADFVDFDGEIVFSGVSEAAGNEVFVLDPDEMTARTYDLNSGAAGSNPAEFTEYRGNLFFSAETEDVGRELFFLDGASGKVRSIDVNDGPDESDPEGLLVYDGALYFSAFRPDVGRELFRFDGGRTADLVADYLIGEEGSHLTPLGVVNGVMALSFQGEAGADQLASYSDGSIVHHEEVVGFSASTFMVVGGDWMIA